MEWLFRTPSLDIASHSSLRCLVRLGGQEIFDSTSTHATASVCLSMLTLVSLSLQPQGKCMTHGMITGQQAFMEIVMMTNTAAGLLWAGWPNCSGTQRHKGGMSGRRGPTMDNLMTVELVLGTNSTQYQGHSEALA